MISDYPKDLSVVIFAYNHEKYIEQTIMSVVQQETKYRYEIVVNDDCSTDQTYAIIRSLQSKYPGLIRIIRNEKNLGLNQSFKNAIRSVESPYISLLGGDDYWIVSDKIEKQLDIFYADNTIGLVHTSYKQLYEETGKIVNGCNKNWQWPEGKTEKIEKIIFILKEKWRWRYPKASSACFRRDPLLKAMDDFPWILETTFQGEGTFLHFAICMFGGNYSFINEDTVMYRIRYGSLSNKKTKFERYTFLEQYALLRYRMCERLPFLNDCTKMDIKKHILNNLFRSSLGFGQKHRFAVLVRQLDLPIGYKKKILFKCSISRWYFFVYLILNLKQKTIKFTHLCVLKIRDLCANCTAK